jgi:SAM-dependent methyltransferase
MPAVGHVDLGSLDRITPVSRDWGFDRGTPVDRLYIEDFISDCRSDVHGHVLEVADNTYTVRFGGNRVSKSDILHNVPGSARATMVLDLVNTDEAPSNRFDCIICTQTLHLIYDLKSAIRSLHKMLKPGGILLLTAPTISAISRWDMDRHGDHWRFTSATIRRLFDEVFEGAELDLRIHGNVYAATAFLHGLAVEELDPEKLAHCDPDYEMLIGLRVKKQPESE